MLLITRQKHIIPNTGNFHSIVFFSQTYVVCVVTGNVDSFSHCSSLSVSEKLSSSLLMPTKSTESTERVFLCVGLATPAFLDNDALDDEAKESASENVTRT